MVMAGALLFPACIYEFSIEELEIEGLSEEMVVIEGDILAGDYSKIRVYTSIPLDGDPVATHISGAKVWVEDDGGVKLNAVVNWVNGTPGTSHLATPEYMVNTTALDFDKKYKLCVDIPGRGLYETNYQSVTVTPQIDSITFSINADSTSLVLEVTTHNDAVEPLYCKWTYESDWEIQAFYRPAVHYTPALKVYELTPEEVAVREYCWGSEVSKDIYLADSEDLSKNVLYKQRLNSIGYTDKKLDYLYSILVSQVALTEEGYTYWNNMKKNSSDLGGLFAPQPNEVRGNIYSTTRPEEAVLGYVAVTTKATLRKYITSREAKIYDKDPLRECTIPLEYKYSSDPEQDQWGPAYSSGMLPIYYVYNDKGQPILNAAYWCPGFCSDCRFLGSKNKPSYWPNDHE